MDNNKYHILILSSSKLRAGMLRGYLEEYFKDKVTIEVRNEVPGNEELVAAECICLMDLMSSQSSASSLIDSLKEKKPDIKLIALHVYRSNILIDPLFKLGINGYINHEPSRKELIEAICTVSRNRLYRPAFS